MSFSPIATDRLVLRPLVEDDAESLAKRRSDPLVAEYQNWVQPFPRERAERMVTSLIEMAGPANEEWYMVSVVERDSGRVAGDLSMYMSWDMRSAEVGYSFSPEFWGQGYATEALAALVAWLFESVGITRAYGMLHPDNVASARVLERTGFLFEGHTRQSYWDGNECSDDWIYGMTRPDWEAWRDRLRSAPTRVALVAIDQSNDRAALGLKTHRSQRSFVAPMEWSLANALIPEIVNGAPLVPWLRAVDADDELVGFVMVARATAAHPEPYLWRFLIDRAHQQRGIGTRALDLVVDECRAGGATTLLTSWVPGRGSPEPFYLRYGFEPTGDIVDGEIEARLTFG